MRPAMLNSTYISPALEGKLSHIEDFPVTTLVAPIGYGKSRAAAWWACLLYTSQQRQGRHHGAGGMEAPQQPLRQDGEEAQAAEAAHHRQHRKEAGQGPEVIVAQVCPVRRDEEGGDGRRQHGDHRHGVGAEPGEEPRGGLSLIHI